MNLRVEILSPFCRIRNRYEVMTLRGWELGPSLRGLPSGLGFKSALLCWGDTMCGMSSGVGGGAGGSNKAHLDEGIGVFFIFLQKIRWSWLTSGPRRDGASEPQFPPPTPPPTYMVASPPLEDWMAAIYFCSRNTFFPKSRNQ